MRIFPIIITLLLVYNSNSQTPETTARSCSGINVDGQIDDWRSCITDEITMDLRQVGLPDSGSIANGIRARFAHDDANIYVLATITGRYFFNLTGGNPLAHSVAVMWKIGENATMNNMGGCSILVQDSSNCTQVRDKCANGQCGCAAHLVDIWHMETASPGALPGVQYPWRQPHVFPDGGNSVNYNPETEGAHQQAVERLFTGNDRTSNSDDEFSVHPCLRSDDGSGSSYVREFREERTQYQNQIRYAWSHSAIDSSQYPFGTNGAEGDYIYEWSRPLSTLENTDAIFRKGETAYFAFAFWIPPELGTGWEDANHYVAPASFQFGAVTLSGASPIGTNVLMLLVLLAATVIVTAN